MNGPDCVDGVCRARAGAEMTIYTAIALREQLRQCLHTGLPLELDLSEVSEADSTGIQLLIQAKREGARLGVAVRFVAHSPVIQEMIDLYHLGAQFGDPMVMPSN